MSGRLSPRWIAPRIARLENLRQRPAVFGHRTGLTVAVFDELVTAVVPVVEAAHRAKLDRPDRPRAIGGGDDFDLSTASTTQVSFSFPSMAVRKTRPFHTTGDDWP